LDLTRHPTKDFSDIFLSELCFPQSRLLCLNLIAQDDGVQKKYSHPTGLWLWSPNSHYVTGASEKVWDEDTEWSVES
jgi:hypothetical protein